MTVDEGVILHEACARIREHLLTGDFYKVGDERIKTDIDLVRNFITDCRLKIKP